MADDLVRQFPPDTHASLAELRQLARSVKTLAEWKEKGRRATPDEIALAEIQRKPYHCAATSQRTGLPCTKPRVLGATCCRKHSAATKHVIRKAEQRLLEMTSPVLERLYALALQDEHKPAAVNAGRDLLDRVALGAIAQAKVRSSQKDSGNRVVVSIGFLNRPKTSEPIVIDHPTTEDKD